MKKALNIDYDEFFDTHYRTRHKRFEYLRRRAFSATHNSVNRVLDEMFPRGWQRDLERLRSEQRKIGYKDSEFYHAAVKRRLGIKYKPGRKKKILTPVH